MEKDRGTKVVALVALCVAIVGLSIGFAAYSNTLDINTDANVKTNPNDFSVDFSASSSELDDTAANISITGSTDGVADLSAVTIDNGNNLNPVITGLTAKFTAPG